jgi:hypothetical protein
MMSLRIIFSLFLFINFASAETKLEFSVLSETKSKIEYQSRIFSKPDCNISNDCKLYIGKISDSYKIVLNDEVLIDSLSKYTAFDSVELIFLVTNLKIRI